jgi:hypothetical protein
VREVRRRLFSYRALLLQAGVLFPQTLEFLIEMFVLDLLVLALHPVICLNPGMECVLIDPEVTGRLGNRLLRFDGEFHGALFEFGRIAFRCGFTHRTHPSRFGIALVSVCPEEYSHIRPYMHKGKAVHRPERLVDDDFSIVKQYQAEYRGFV